MKRKHLKTALFCGLVFSLSLTGLYVRGDDQGKNVKAPPNRGDGNRVGVQAGQERRDGNQDVRRGGRGGIHSPSTTRSRQSSGRGEGRPQANRTPTFSRPEVRNRQGTTTVRSPVIRPNRNPQISIEPRMNNQRDRRDVSVGPDRSRVRIGIGQRSRNTQANQLRIVNRPFNGNTFSINSRRVNVGNNSYRPSYYRHNQYHGYWNGNRGFGNNYGSGRGTNFGIVIGTNDGFGGSYGPGWGWGISNGQSNGFYRRNHRGFGRRPFGWGLGGWGLGSLNYNSGYLNYNNPYYVTGNSNGYDYSQPIPVVYNSQTEIPGTVANSANEFLNNADAAFQNEDYDAALDIVNKGIERFPDDAVLHEFRSLTLFAREDYQQAASTIHSVLAVGPGWDWTTLSSMYADVSVYTKQLRSLEAYTRANPQDAGSRMLLAYHYMSCGHPDSAARQLKQVVKLMPNDEVAADFLQMVAVETEGSPQELPPEAETSNEPSPIDSAMLLGSWKASREDGSQFRLDMRAGSQFTWRYTNKNQPAQEFAGTYSVENNVLALERKDGGSLVAEVTLQKEDSFNFTLIGAPSSDQGLDFTK